MKGLKGNLGGIMKARSQGTVKDSKGLMSERKRERAELPVHGEGIDRRKWRSKRNGRGKLLNATWRDNK